MHESVIVGVLTFTATGARAPAAPILLCGLTLLLAILLKRCSKIRDVAYFTCAANCGFILGMILFFRAGTEFNGASFITFTGQPFTFLLSPDQYLLTFPRTLIGLGFPALLAALISFLIIAAFQAGFLTPPLVYNLVTMSRRTLASEDILLIGMSIAGISAVFLTVAPGYSQFSFLHYTNIAASLLGAQGLRLVLERVRYRERISELLLVSTGIGLALHLAQLPVESLNWIRKQLPYAIAVLFAGSASDEKAERQTIRSCARDVDEELFAIASRTGKDPVVIIVPDNKTVFSYHPCQTLWWTVLHPTRTVQSYALEAMVGEASGAFERRLLERRVHFRAAAASAEQGKLAVGELINVAATVQTGSPAYVITGRSLYTPDPRITLVAENDRLMLLMINSRPQG